MTSTPPELRDGEARRRIREDLDATLFVEAAAGTGKTSVLVARIVALLRSGGTSLERIVAVTFTDKAAGEMKLRLRAEIEAARTSEATATEERRRLDEALGQLEVARIGTIHSLCADLLHERPVEAGVDPLFEVAAQDEQERFLDRAFEAWFQEILADPPEGVRRVLRRRARGPQAASARLQLRGAAVSLVEHRDFSSPWRRDPFDRCAQIDRVMARLAEIAPLAERAARSNDWLARNLAEIGRFVEENVRREEVRGRDHDGLEAALREVARFRSWRWKGGRPDSRYGRDLPRQQVLAQRDAVKEELDHLLEAADADLAPLLREELRPVIDAYETLKQRAGKLDFLDLLIRARELVRKEPEVRAELQSRFSHFFVDEFQDTDPLQAEILLLLAADDPQENDWTRVTPIPGKLFLVGDPKQSIYRFRRADVAIYEATKRRLAARGAAVVHLTTSFRALPSIQHAVNAAFEPFMRGGDGGQAGYVALEPYRPEVRDRPSVLALPVPRPYVDYGNRAQIRNWQIETSFPDAVGALVDWLVHESGWTVTARDRPDQQVPLEARHICLLFRRFKRFRDDMTRLYVRALEVRRIPHVLVGGRSFHDREEVLAIRNALCAIEWPEDELRVFATLRGPLFALGDDALLAYRHRLGKLHPLRRLDPDSLEGSDLEVADALAVLARLHRERNRRPLADTIVRLLEAVRAHAGIAIWPTGEQALANCLRVVDLARRFERQGAPSFRAFVERMEEDAERGEAQEAPVVEEGTEGVRIMTVHRAKGLEFPVVVLADPTCGATRQAPTRYVDPARGLWVEPLCGCTPPELLEQREVEGRHDREEATRLAYVAATRARDLLVVPTVGDDRIEGWIDLLNPVVYPESESRRKARPAPGCPQFGKDSVVGRPESAYAGPGASVAPGLHRPNAGSHGVVWWDPHTLELEREPEVGLRQQRILEADREGARDEAGVRAHERWQAARSEALGLGARPFIAVSSVTELAGSGAGSLAGPEEITLLDVPLERAGRPHGRRFGTLVHATLAAVALDADDAGVQATARAQGRLVGADPEEVEAAARAVRAALEHPLLRRAASSAQHGGLRRETPVLLHLDDGTLAEGVVDLAFRESEENEAGIWTVVDFKTDRELASHRPEYEAQVRLYLRAVSTATGEPARGVLLTV